MSEKQVDTLVKYWEKEIRRGLEYKKQFTKPKDWETYKKYYRGDWKEGLIPVNKIFSFGKSMVPRTYFRNPTVSVTALRPEFEWHARVVEAVDNYLIKELNLKYQLKRGILDTYLCGTGPIKLGYDSEFGYLPVQKLAEDSSTATQVGKDTGELIEYRVNVKPGMPWALRVTPEDVITPAGYTTAEEFPWICHMILRPLEDVKADQKYKNVGDLKGGYQLKEIDRPKTWDRYGGVNLCLLKEIRDLKRGRIVVICESKVLLEAEDALQIEGIPWEFITFNPDPDYFWGIPDVRIGEPQQLELNEVKLQQSKHRRLTLLKFLYQKGTITSEQLEKVLGEEVGPGIETLESPASVISLLQPHMPPELWREAAEILMDFRETLGYSRNQAGEFVAPESPRSATEVMAVKEATEIRSDERRDIVADVFINIIRKWNQYIFKYWTGEKVIQVVGPEGTQHWIKYTGEELRGEYSLQLDPDSGLPITRQLRYRQARELFMLFKGDPYIDQTMLHKLLLRQFEWIDPTWSLIINPQTSQVPPTIPEMGTSDKPVSIGDVIKGGK